MTTLCRQRWWGWVQLEWLHLTTVGQGAAFFASRQGSKRKFCLDNAAIVFNACFVLDANMWLDDCDQLRRHGNQKVAFAANHSASLLRGCHKDELVGLAGAEGVCNDKLQGLQPSCTHTTTSATTVSHDSSTSSVAVFKCTGQAMLFCNAKYQNKLPSLTEHFTLDGLIRIKKLPQPVDVFEPTNTYVICFEFVFFCRWHAWMKMLLCKYSHCSQINFV